MRIKVKVVAAILLPRTSLAQRVASPWAATIAPEISLGSLATPPSWKYASLLDATAAAAGRGRLTKKQAGLVGVDNGEGAIARRSFAPVAAALLGALVALLPAGPVHAVQTPPALGDGDLVVAGLSGNADSGSVRRLLGRPDSVVLAEDVLGEQAAEWHYRDLIVSFGEDGRLDGVLLRSARYATARGLRVGDRVGRLIGLYPKATKIIESSARARKRGDGLWIYHLPSVWEGPPAPSALVQQLVQRGIQVQVWNGEVACVYVGLLATESAAFGC